MRFAIKALAQDLRDAHDPFWGKVIREGEAAAWDGKELADNPYPNGSRYAGVWADGFQDAKRKTKTAETDYRKEFESE